MDESRIVQSCGDESAVLPPRLSRGLREALACALPDKAVPLTPAHNLIASEALIALFVQLFGHYRDHIITSATTGQREFQVCLPILLCCFNFDCIFSWESKPLATKALALLLICSHTLFILIFSFMLCVKK